MLVSHWIHEVLHDRRPLLWHQIFIHQYLPHLSIFCFNGTDDHVLLDQVMESLPALPSCELMDPADDQTLPRLIEALEKRHRVRQIMSEQLNQTGRQPSLIPPLIVRSVISRGGYGNTLFFALCFKTAAFSSSSQYAEVHASAAWWSAHRKGNLPPWSEKQTGREGKTHQQPETGDRAIREKVQNPRVQGAATLHWQCSMHTGRKSKIGVFSCPPAQVDILQKTTEMYEQDKRSLQQELETREQRLQKELTDRRRIEHRMQGVVTDTNAKWEKECVSEREWRGTRVWGHLSWYQTKVINVLCKCAPVDLLGEAGQCQAAGNAEQAVDEGWKAEAAQGHCNREQQRRRQSWWMSDRATREAWEALKRQRSQR